MIDKDALAYLQANLVGHRHLVTNDNIASSLVELAGNSKIESLEQFQDAPNRIKQKAKLFSCESFCSYVNRFRDEATTVYLNVDAGRFAAVLDHHDSDAGNQLPAWCDHRAIYEPKQSLEWGAWTGIHKRPMSQTELAMFIEEQLDSIAKPEPNEMLKAALDFQSNESLVLGSTTNLDDGSTRFSFTKDNVTKNVTFPHRVQIWIPLHENEARNLLDLRVRYRTNSDGVLTFIVSFVKDPNVIQRDALLALQRKIEELVSDVSQYEGTL